MGKLISINQKKDPVQEWEDKNQLNNKKTDLSYIPDKLINYVQSKPKISYSPKQISRIAEILAMKEEIQKSLSTRCLISVMKDKSAIEKRRKEILNIKRVLQT